MAEEIYMEKGIYGPLSEVQMVRDLDLDLGSGQGHTSIHSTSRTIVSDIAIFVPKRDVKLQLTNM